MTDSREIVTYNPIYVRSDKSQVIEYENPLFQCYAGKSFYAPDVANQIPEHWHEELELIYVVDGSLDYNVNGEQFVLNPGEGVLVNSRRVHANSSKRGEYALFYCILIHPFCMRTSSYLDQQYLLPMIGPNSVAYVKLSKDDWTKVILDEIESYFDNLVIEGRELEIVQSCLKILNILYKKLPPELGYSGLSPEYVATFKEMVSFISEHYMEKVSLDDIAEAGNVGKTLCAKIFKKLSAKTPGDYLINYRISKSIELLEANELSITEIAYNTGFNSASHYTKTFHDIIGCTPNKYRNV